MIDRKTENNLKNNYYVLIFDSLWENPLSNKPNYLAVFLYILSHAYKKDKEFIFNNQKTIVKRGQWLGSFRKIANHFGISISTVFNICQYLKTERIIEHQPNAKFTLFTVLNYDMYQPQLNAKLNNSRTVAETKDNVYKDNNILYKYNILHEDKLRGKFGNNKVNFILETYKKYFNHSPTDKRPRNVAHTFARSIDKFIKDIELYKKYEFEELVEKIFAWYDKKYELKGDTLDVIRRKAKMLFEATLEKYRKGGENK